MGGRVGERGGELGQNANEQGRLRSAPIRSTPAQEGTRQARKAHLGSLGAGDVDRLDPAQPGEEGV